MSYTEGEFAGPKAQEAVDKLRNSLPFPDKSVVPGTDLYCLQQSILGVEHLVAPNQEASVDGQNYIAHLPEMDVPPLRLPNISRSVGRILIAGSLSGSRPETVRELVPPDRAAQSVTVFDEAGMLPDSFWPDFGIHAVASADAPQFLPLLHAKLTGPKGESLLAQVQNPQIAAGHFITRVLRSYAADPKRSALNTQRLLQRTKLAGAVRDGVDLHLLVQEANALTRAFSEHQRQEDAFAPLDDSRLVSVGDAFLRVLSVTRSPGTPAADRAAQLEHDIAHADIVSMVLSQRRPEWTLSPTELALRFPDLTPQHRRRIYELVEAGMPVSEALALLQK